jgi:hypothetical protein
VRLTLAPIRLVASAAAAANHPVMKLSTLADVRDLVDKHLPEQYRRKPTWRHVSTEIAKAADGEKDLLEICVSLRLVLALEGVDCLVK